MGASDCHIWVYLIGMYKTYRFSSSKLPPYWTGGWVIFQRSRKAGVIIGKVAHIDWDCYWFEFDRPTSLGDALEYLVSYGRLNERGQYFGSDFFELEP